VVYNTGVAELLCLKRWPATCLRSVAVYCGGIPKQFPWGIHTILHAGKEEKSLGSIHRILNKELGERRRKPCKTWACSELTCSKSYGTKHQPAATVCAANIFATETQWTLR
jgi:hypothetical protein